MLVYLYNVSSQITLYFPRRSVNFETIGIFILNAMEFFRAFRLSAGCKTRLRILMRSSTPGAMDCERKNRKSERTRARREDNRNGKESRPGIYIWHLGMDGVSWHLSKSFTFSKIRKPGFPSLIKSAFLKSRTIPPNCDVHTVYIGLGES